MEDVLEGKLCATFSSIYKAFAENTLRVLCLLVFIPLPHGSDDSVDQSTDSGCSSTFSAPFQTAWDPNGVVPKIGAVQRGSTSIFEDPAQWILFAVETPI